MSQSRLLNDNDIASCSADMFVIVWNVSKGFMSRSFTGHTDTVNSIAYSADGKQPVSSSADTAVRIWNTTDTQHHRVLRAHQLPVNSATFLPDNKLVGSCSDDGTIRLWDAKTGVPKGVL